MSTKVYLEWLQYKENVHIAGALFNLAERAFGFKLKKSHRSKYHSTNYK